MLTLPPKYFIFPLEVIKAAPRSENWGKVNIKNIPNYERYEEAWHLIADFIGITDRK